MRVVWSLVAVTCWSTACASTGTTAVTDTAENLRARIGVDNRIGATGPAPAAVGVTLSDGLSRDEAVALALWNNPGFQAATQQLGFARADLVEAGLLTNPTLALLFPVGPKQLEATLRWPVEVLWERPRRVAAARIALAVVAQNLVQSGLDLALAVRIGFVDLTLVSDRLVLARESAAALGRISSLSETRLRAGDVAELDARAARVDATRSAQDADRLMQDVVVARERLRLLIGLAADDPAVSTLERTAAPSPSCGPDGTLLERGLAARPDVRAAELAIEGAAARLGWERRRILQLTAVLDANGQGTQGFESGPGVDAVLPLFNRNQGGRLRGETELLRASAAYVAVQRQVAFDVREAAAQLAQATQSNAVWARDIVAPLEANLADAEASYVAGDTSYLFVLENTRRLIDARVRAREIQADAERATARLERAVGTNCRGSVP